MNDPTKMGRKILTKAINSDVKELEALTAKYGTVWSTGGLTKEFIVDSFKAPYVFVTRKSDGVKGTLLFQHSPRYYFDFQEGWSL